MYFDYNYGREADRIDAGGGGHLPSGVKSGLSRGRAKYKERRTDAELIQFIRNIMWRRKAWATWATAYGLAVQGLAPPKFILCIA
ncbi:hypothetical protein EVAR_59006_1 [Eumeta japonica]|uniref:Uncharacterized protein n=1 Tax=Eumeta variegata TaxID=151549 RepID=A0A4C1ZM13_EUMVA|nr:hypothetical protein EVAR_59006_1 [Eumeta japonica]